MNPEHIESVLFTSVLDNPKRSTARAKREVGQVVSSCESQQIMPDLHVEWPSLTPLSKLLSRMVIKTVHLPHQFHRFVVLRQIRLDESFVESANQLTTMLSQEPVST